MILPSDIKVAAGSGYNDSGDEARLKGSGMPGFIRKPIGMAELAGALREMLGDRPNNNFSSHFHDEGRIKPRYQVPRGTFVIFEQRSYGLMARADVLQTVLNDRQLNSG